MTDYLIVPDISHYQTSGLTTSYPRDFIIFKATQGTTYLDSAFLANAGVAHSLHDAGKLAGAVVYHVYSTDSPDAQFNKIKWAIGPTPPPWLAGVMIDVESWPGTSYEIRGDHSSGINALYGSLAAWLGSTRAVWIYGNGGDLANLAPHRDTRAPIILAAYTSELRYKQYANGLGQQYSNGMPANPVPVIDGQALPRSTPTIGNCDHNVFPGFKNGAALRAWMYPPPPPPPQEDDGMADITPERFTQLLLGALKDKNVASALHDAAIAHLNEDAAQNRHTISQHLSRLVNPETNEPLFVPFVDENKNPRPMPPVKKA